MASKYKSFIVFLKNLVSGTFICADNESKIKQIALLPYIGQFVLF